jgi:hypothetical protein
MECWEAVFIQALHHQKLLIEEQQVGDRNPLFRLAQVPLSLLTGTEHSQQTSPLRTTQKTNER